jgi:hypothetical protein
MSTGKAHTSSSGMKISRIQKTSQKSQGRLSAHLSDRVRNREISRNRRSYVIAIMTGAATQGQWDPRRHALPHEHELVQGEQEQRDTAMMKGACRRQIAPAAVTSSAPIRAATAA